MSVPGCAGYMPGDEKKPFSVELPPIGSALSDSFRETTKLMERLVALESLYSAMKEATHSPCGYTPKIADAMKKLKELEG